VKKLKELIGNIKVIKTVGNIDTAVVGITDNSRLVKPNFLFFAIKGVSLDGHRYINNAIEKGCKVFIGMAGMSAALPGVIASMTHLPVIGVPVGGKVPFDSLLSVVQMPPGVPVASVGVDRGDNAAVLSVQILSQSNSELTEKLIPYVKARGFTHIELMPISEHPFDGSWGYQVTGWYAPTSRYGNPDEFRVFVDRCHEEGIGVILDWVPGHFPKDEHGLAFFDGSHLYEHSDPRIGEHKEWGTLIFNYSRNEVRNFLVANLVYWFEQFHIDGIRVDAVASMLYRDYLRPEGEWIPNEHGGNENYEAVNFLQQANHVLFQHFPGALSIAEESTTWNGVTKPTDAGGLGFNLKWNMGWMHDMLDYFEIDPWFRQFHQNNVTFSICYNYTENFMLSLSHDEVVHGKSHLLHKMPGDDWKKYANTRALLAYMWTHPGKKTIFMGMEFGQRQEWNVWDDLQWELLEHEPHKGINRLIDDLNSLYKSQPALWRDDFKEYGFQWIDCKDNSNSVISFMRRESQTGQWLIVVANFTPEVHSGYRVGVPVEGFYKEIFNTDSDKYGGSNVGNLGGKISDKWEIHGYENALELSLPPLSVIVLKHQK